MFATITSMGTKSQLGAYQACLMHMRAERNLTIVIQKVLEQHGLTKSEWLALSLIYDGGEGGRSNSQLSQELGVGLPHITALLKTLIRLELVDQRHNTEDRRANTTVITINGSALLYEVEAKIRRRLQKWLSVLPPKKRKDYLETVAFLSKQPPENYK